LTTLQELFGSSVLITQKIFYEYFRSEQLRGIITGPASVNLEDSISPIGNLVTCYEEVLNDGFAQELHSD
jgi:hypothetical protein